MSESPDPVETVEDDVPEHFREQPGDREPEPEAETAAEAEDDGTEEGTDDGEHIEEEADSTDDVPAEATVEAQDNPPQKKDWRDRQIAKLREKEKAREAELEELRKEAETAKALLAASQEEREAGTLEQTREQIRREEAEKVRAEEYTKRLNKGLEDMDAAGKQAFGAEWDTRIVQAAELFGQELAKRPDILEALTDLPNSAAVYHELAGDLDKMEALIGMPAYKMGAELARMSDRLGAPKPAPKVSKAPKPIKPISTEGVERDLDSLINDPNASMEEINRRMAAEEKKRARAH